MNENLETSIFQRKVTTSKFLSSKGKLPQVVNLKLVVLGHGLNNELLLAI